MADKEAEYPSVICRLANCTHTRLSGDNYVYYAAPNGLDCHGKPVQVTNCTIRPIRIYISTVHIPTGEVVDCDSRKLMDAA